MSNRTVVENVRFVFKIPRRICESRSENDQPQFNADQQSSTEGRSFPFLPEIKLEGYLQKIIVITLDYLSQTYFDAADLDCRAQRYSREVELYQQVVAADPQCATGRYKLS